ncbi:MAG: sensor domain-containing diguanylate cyclase [Desulfovibrio sp.]|uniref:sensor domain-containing diguanylate cyclase n=1 Tax=Desulfovibrio sp. TaxID=885 RepID=UPI0039E50633
MRKPSTFFTVFTASLCCCLLAVFFLVQRRAQVEFSRLENIILAQRDDLKTELTSLLFKTQVLAALVVQNDGHVIGFDDVAKVIADSENIETLALAPAGVVSYVYPLQGHEALLGMNLLDLSDGASAVTPTGNAGISLYGPLKRPDGTAVLVGQLPVFLKDADGQRNFWGIASIALRFPQALEAADLDLLEAQGLTYEILKVNPKNQEQETIAGSARPFDGSAPHLIMPLQIFNAHWYFRISSSEAWYKSFENWIYVFFASVLSLLLASLAQRNHDLANARRRLEEMVYKDPLTGILNRRGLFQVMADRTGDENNEKFCLYYMDLNQFKAINDTYGHKAGDRVLQHFAAAIQAVAPQDSAFARMGGDEFILVLFCACAHDYITSGLARVAADLAKGLPSEGPNMPISFSVGKAEYPDDGQTLDELLSRADKAMYQDKEHSRRQFRLVAR